MRQQLRLRPARVLGILLTTFLPMAELDSACCSAAEPAAPGVPNERQWRELNRVVDRALTWLSTQQQTDGSFPTLEQGQPAVSALCVLAFLATDRASHSEDRRAVVRRCVEYILASQREDGLIARVGPPRGNSLPELMISAAAAYNHAIAGLTLSEVYGMAPEREPEIRSGIERALRFSLERQPAPKRRETDKGGWRYLKRHQISDSDLSVTSWYLMFLRSCRNAGFEVPSGAIDEGTAYVLRCYEPRSGQFWYALQGVEHVTTRAMTGAGILSLSLAGRHDTPMARAAGDWLLEHPFVVYEKVGRNDRFFYGGFYCSQAMFQLGGRYWSAFYPRLLRTLAELQQPDGSWGREVGSDGAYGTAYTTALAVLALSPPYQILPIFQR